MSLIFWREDDSVCLKNYVLIMPSISVGNVGQLAVDMLLNNLTIDHVAHIPHPSIIPLVGPDPYDKSCKKLTTSCQLYICKEKKLAIMQLRTPLIRRKVPEFREFLVKFIKDHQFKKAILLSSSFAHFFTMEDLEGVPIHYLCTSASSSDDRIFSELSWKKFALNPKVEASEASAIPGGGIAKSLFDDCEKENIPFVVLVLICSEGNNYPESYKMVQRLNDWLHFETDGEGIPEKWKKPISWAVPYGSPAPFSIY